MKYLIAGVFLLMIITGCKKDAGVTPSVKTGSTDNGNNGKSTDTTNKPIDTNVFIHQIKIVAPSQFVSTSVSGDTLKMIYYENVSLLIPTDGLVLSYALHIIEDFSTSELKNFDYTTYDQSGDVTYDWVDDNLNNITAKTEKDTIIKGVNTTKITIQRPFIFKKTYPYAELAQDEQHALLNKLDDNVTFTAYVYFGIDYPASTVAANLFYLKAK